VKVKFCTSCRALIFSDFRFCPYCGSPVSRGPTCIEALSGPFSKMEAERSTVMTGNDYFASIDERLSQLETELENILSGGGTELSER